MLTRVLVGFLMFLMVSGCSSSDAYDAMSASEGASADFGGDGDISNSFGDTEEEAENEAFLAVAPAFADAHIFVANPTVDSISKIAVREPHPIEVIPVGLYPTLVKSVGDRVLVLNSGDHSITFVTAATSKTFTVPIPKEINDVVFNTLGFAVAYVDEAKLPKEIEGGSQSTDLFSIIDIENGLIVTKGLSFAPKHVVFTKSNPPLALLAADAKGVLVDLSRPNDKPAILSFSGVLSPASLEEAAITPDGARAFFRESGRQGIRTVELAGQTVGAIAGDAVPTDMDLSPDGATLYVSDRASYYRMRMFDASDAGLALLDTVTSATAYRQSEFSSDGTVAVLFTSSESSTVAGILDVVGGSIKDVDVQVPVRNALVAPDGKNALLLHQRVDAEPQKVTMLNLATGEEPDVDLAGTIHKVDFTPDGDFAFVTTTDPNYVAVFSLRTGLHNVLELNKTPVFLSALPYFSSQAFVTQEHEVGQVTFLQTEQTLSTVKIVPDDVIGFLLGTTAE